MPTGKREHIHVATLDFGSIGAGATAELVVETGVPSLLACAINPPEGFEADLVATAYAVPARNEVQNVTNDGTGGTFNLSFGGSQSAEIGYDATAAQVELALEDMASIVDVAVTKNGASDWDIEFLNPGVADLALMTKDDTNMTGQITGTVVSEVTKGRATGTAIVRVANVSAAPIDPASQDFNIVCWF